MKIIILKTIEEINEKLKINSIKERKKYVPNIERTLRDLAFDPKEFKVLTRQIKSKKEQEILISKKIKAEQKYYAELINKEYKLVNKKKLEVKEINNSDLEKLIDMIKNDKSEFLKEVNKVRKKLKKKKSFINEATDMNKDNSKLKIKII